jgi:hypothetical protein
MDIHPLSTFRFERILSVLYEKCEAHILGTMLMDEIEQTTILILRKDGWSEKILKTLNTKVLDYTVKTDNGLKTGTGGLGKWKNIEFVFPTSSIVNIICPAMQEDILKYTRSGSIVITETKELYNKITLPRPPLEGSRSLDHTLRIVCKIIRQILLGLEEYSMERRNKIVYCMTIQNIL